MKKLIYLAIISILFCVNTINAQLIFQENFDYTSNQSLTSNGWLAVPGNNTNPVLCTSSGLSYSGYALSAIANAATLSQLSGQDVYKDAAISMNNGNVFASFMLKVDSPRLSRRPREEGTGAGLIVRVIGTASCDPLFEKRDPGNSEQQERHQQRTEDCPCRSGSIRNQEESPPNAEVAKIIRVPSESPQASVHDFAGVGGIGLKSRHLEIANRLEQKAHQPNARTDQIEHAERHA